MKYGVFLSLFVLSWNLTGQDLVCSKIGEAMSGKKRSAARLTDPRQNDFDVNFYFLDLEADNLSTNISGTVIIKATVTTGSLNEFVVELADELTISEVLVDDASAAFSHTDNLVVITLPEALPDGQLFEVSVSYAGTPPSDAGFFAGISSELGPYNIPVTWTLSEPFNASDWFPVKQVLTDQADSVNIYLTVPDHLMAAASGTLKNTVPVAGNKLRFEWETRYPMAYYLISMAIAPYRLIEQQVYLPGTPDPMPVQNFIYDDDRVENEVIDELEFTPQMLTLFSELVGPYPFLDEKYGHAMAPMGGGMEHQTISTMAGFNFTLIAHELFHQWYGDDITCKTWQDIWINEGFARYGEYLAIENLISQEDADAWMTSNYNHILTQPGGSVYVPEESANDPNRIFDFRLTYNKGGALLHMLRYVMGNDNLFFEALRTYSINYSGQTVSGDDFKNFLQDYTQIPLDAFFNEWYYGEGYPIYQMEWSYNDGVLSVMLDQTTSAPDVTPFFSTPLPILIETASGASLFSRAPDSNSAVFTFNVPEEVINVELDPRNIILKKTGTVTSVTPDLPYGYRVFPNPASQNFNIEVTSGLSYQASLTDLQGRTVRTAGIHPHEISTISTADLAPGIYLLQLSNANGAWISRIEIIR